MPTKRHNNPMLELLKAGKFSDFKIHCGGEVFNAHKTILFSESNSDYLRVVVDGPFCETAEGELTLPEEEPVTLAYILIAICTGLVGFPSIVDLNIVFPGLVGRHLPALEDFCEMVVQNDTPPQDKEEFQDRSLQDRFVKGFLECLRLELSGYMLADRILMSELKKGLSDRYADEMKLMLTGPDRDLFPDSVCSGMLANMYEILEPRDPLRIRVTSFCVMHQNAGVLREGNNTRAIIPENEPDGWDVGCEVRKMMLVTAQENEKADLKMKRPARS